MGPRFALFAEVLLTGAVVLLACAGVVTALPAAIAGTAHLRRHVDGVGDVRGAFLRDLRVALTRLPGASVGVVAMIALMIWNIRVCLTTPVAGGPVVAVLSAGLAAATVLVAIRLAGSWSALHPGGSREAVTQALRLSLTDPGGTALLALAVIGVVSFCWMLPLLVVPAPGLLIMAALAVERRRTAPRSRQTA